MSYSFQVEAKDGQLSVVPVTQPNTAVPNGRFLVNGHEDDDWLSVSIARQDETGRQIAQASGYGAKH